jgi:nucleotide-binding universal stress UspA family protein
MKQVIVPTDFSVPAEHAMLFAGQVAQRVDASIILLHVFQMPVSMSEVPVMMIPADELRQNADMGLDRAKELLHQHYPGLSVQTESRMGDVTDELNDVCKDKEIVAIITGKHGASGVEHFFFGSTSLSIVRHTHLPVIVVPENASTGNLHSIALAVDDQSRNLPTRKIKDIVESLGAQLHMIHVQPEKSATKDFNFDIEGLNTTCKTIRDDEFLHGIQSYLQENNIGMLMLLPHKHSFLERLTYRTHTEELLRKITIPVICITQE